MAARDYCCSETGLVRALMRSGLKHGRAVAFERWLDDARPCGVSGSFLHALMMVHAALPAEAPSAPKSQTEATESQGVQREFAGPLSPWSKEAKMIGR